MFNAQCSMLNAQCSMLNAQCSMLNAQCSMLNAQCSMLIKASPDNMVSQALAPPCITMLDSIHSAAFPIAE
jgi:hypothetical protein